jgi:hypothetical protein
MHNERRRTRAEGMPSERVSLKVSERSFQLNWLS